MGSEYGVADWNPATTNRGAQATLTVVHGHADDCATGMFGFVAHALWEGTANSTFQYFAEAGYTWCFENQRGLYNYWADWRSTFGYAEHKIGTTTVGTEENVKIHYIGDNEWEIDLAGSPCCYSVDNPGNSTWMSTGLEATSPFSELDCGTSASLFYLKLENGWQSTWQGAALRTRGAGHVRWLTMNLDEVDWENHSGGC